jgi:hypothetical protein
MATLIRANGPDVVVRPKGATFTLEEMYAAIGGGCDIVQPIALADGRTMWLDEEGKYRDGMLLVNETATRLLAEAGGIPGDVVVGAALVTEPEEMEE